MRSAITRTIRRRLPFLRPGASLLVCLSLASAPVVVQGQERDGPGAQQSTGNSLSAYLLTAEPGDQVWELFGHNGVLLRDESTGFEGVYHYGLFDMYSAGFIPRFLRGEMMYMSGVSDLPYFLASYELTNRKVWAQRLDLTPDQLVHLRELLDTSVAPENRTYRYDYFRNNCSTRIRDILDQVVGGQLQEATDKGPADATWRTHTRRLTAPATLNGIVGYLGIQLLLGPRGDEETTAWQEAWVPMKLRDEVASLQIAGPDGVLAPWQASVGLWSDSDREPEVASPPRRGHWFLLAGVLLATFLWVGARGASPERRAPAVLGALIGAAWGLLAGLLGLLFVAVHWTDHEFMYWNQNVLIFSPLALALVLLVPLAYLRGASSSGLRRITGAALGLMGLAVLLWILPWTRQGNGEWLLFGLPVYGSLWWVAHRLLPRTDLAGKGTLPELA